MSHPWVAWCWERSPRAREPVRVHWQFGCSTPRFLPPTFESFQPAHRPVSDAMAAFTGKILEFADETRLPETIRAWFVKNNVVTFEDVALTCTAETEVIASLCEPAAAEEVAAAKGLAGKVQMKKFWIACRAAYDEGKRSKEDNTAVIEAPMPQRENKD